jgi:hypothetical protein
LNCKVRQTGTTHVTLADRAEWLVSMITQFLDVKDAMGK